MIEIRTIEMGECEEFLRLLCKVFSLDFRRAHDAFFKEPMYDLNRKWAVFEDGVIVSTLTTVSALFGDGRGIGIAGVATEPERQGENLATMLLQEVLRQSESRGEPRALLFAANEDLYVRCGFRVLDAIVSQPLPKAKSRSEPELLSRDQVRSIFDAWSEEKPYRLRRDDRRWDHWRWNLKTVYSQMSGYICHELGRVREVLPAYEGLPSVEPAEWYGQLSLAEDLGIELTDPRKELNLMGRGFDRTPHMFLTDQF
ncbi:MAG: GNAT family N-acetyltransferase [Armatimonadetes bacterium]|nr:GNAT family N-acetyltransferase [Armatimonadota bacterium]